MKLGLGVMGLNHFAPTSYTMTSVKSPILSTASYCSSSFGQDQL